MRVVHFTDIHVHSTERIGRVVGKRTLGLANLYLRGRRHQFSAPKAMGPLVREVLSDPPDLLVFSGDMTALATESEFRLASEILEPLFRGIPSIVIPGNHDRYVALAAKRMEMHFGPWMGGGESQGGGPWQGADIEELWPREYRIGGLRFLALDASRPGVLSEGKHHPGEIARLKKLLASGEPTVVVGHYPIWTRDGQNYDRRGRSLRDRDELDEALREHPPLAYLHGHEHRWYVLAPPQVPFPVLCAGNTSHLGDVPGKRAGYFSLEIEAQGVQSLRRHSWDGQGFGAVEDVALFSGASSGSTA